MLSGLLALFFFSIAVVTKLTSDTLDGIDTGPDRGRRSRRRAAQPDAADGDGAADPSGLLLILLYSFELNLRASAVIGLVGAGGIGLRLHSFTSNFDWASVRASS